MSEPTIIETNRAICEFMGWEFKEERPDWYHVFHEGDLMWADNLYAVQKTLLEGFKYHEDWNKLMNVWDKLRITIWREFEENYPIEFVTAQRKWKNYCSGVNLKMAHKTVYEFIEWYNQQKEANNERPG